MQDYDIHDDPPQNIAGRFGKHRPRIDIEFLRVIKRAATSFSHRGKAVISSEVGQRIFGDDGLGMFVAGTYAGWIRPLQACLVTFRPKIARLGLVD